MDLVTLEQAKTHLRVDGIDSDAEISSLIFEASSIIMDYLKKEAPATWNAPDAEVPGTGVPGVVQAATLLVIGTLFCKREDGADPISIGVESLLRRQRDPAFE
jgi:hypothetical protein